MLPNESSGVGGSRRGHLISAANFHLTTHVRKDMNADVEISCSIILHYSQFINFSCVYILENAVIHRSLPRKGSEEKI